MDVEVSVRSRPAGTEPAQRAGDRLEIPGEVLPAQALRGRRRRVRPENPLGSRIDHRRGHGLVDGRRHVPRIGQLSQHAVCAGNGLQQRLEQVWRLMPGLVVEAADGSLHHAVIRDGVRRRARTHPAPDQAEAGPRVHPPGQRRRQLGNDLP